jgi:pyruvate/2-oxoglutarate dehydrogenase complex dihydrolipoamide acyltransferase (E2) component
VLETDKVTIDVQAASAGVITALTVAEGAKVQIGEVIGTIDSSQAGAPAGRPSAAAPAPVVAAAAPAATNGTLVTPDGWSPEHGPAEEGVTYDQMIIHDLFTNTIEAADVLGDDKEFRDHIAGLNPLAFLLQPARQIAFRHGRRKRGHQNIRGHGLSPYRR